MEAKSAAGIPLEDNQTINELKNNKYELYDSDGKKIQNQEKKRKEIIDNIGNFKVLFFDSIKEMKAHIKKTK